MANNKKNDDPVDKLLDNALGVDNKLKAEKQAKAVKKAKAEANKKAQSHKNRVNQHTNHQSKHLKSKSSKSTSNPRQIKSVSNNKSTKSKSKKTTKNKDDKEFSSVRLTVRAIARLNAYQKVSGLKNRSDALNTVLDKALPLLLNNTQKTSAKVIEKLFESNHNGNTK